MGGAGGSGGSCGGSGGHGSGGDVNGLHWRRRGVTHSLADVDGGGLDVAFPLFPQSAELGLVDFIPL